MSEKFLCSRQENCPVVLAACERKVKAESEARLATSKLSEKEAEYARKRPVMNELFSAGLEMRKAQREYFRFRDQKRLEKSKASETRFDEALRSCHALKNPLQQELIFTT